MREEKIISRAKPFFSKISRASPKPLFKNIKVTRRGEATSGQSFNKKYFDKMFCREAKFISLGTKGHSVNVDLSPFPSLPSLFQGPCLEIWLVVSSNGKTFLKCLRTDAEFSTHQLFTFVSDTFCQNLTSHILPAGKYWF